MVATQKRKNVLFVTDLPLTTGLAQVSRLVEIAKVLKRKGFTVLLVGRKGDYIPEIPTIQVSGDKNFARAKIVLDVFKQAVCMKYRVVIVRGELLSFILLFLKAFHVRPFLDFHGWLWQEIQLFYSPTPYNKIKAKVYRIVEWFTVKHTSEVIAVTKYLGKHAEEIRARQRSLGFKRIICFCLVVPIFLFFALLTLFLQEGGS